MKQITGHHNGNEFQAWVDGTIALVACKVTSPQMDQIRICAAEMFLMNKQELNRSQKEFWASLISRKYNDD